MLMSNARGAVTRTCKPTNGLELAVPIGPSPLRLH